MDTRKTCEMQSRKTKKTMMNFELLLLLDCGKLRRNSSKRKIVGLKLAGYARLLSSLTILFTCEAICAREEFRHSGGAGDQAATASALLYCGASLSSHQQSKQRCRKIKMIVTTARSEIAFMKSSQARHLALYRVAPPLKPKEISLPQVKFLTRKNVEIKWKTAEDAESACRKA